MMMMMMMIYSIPPPPPTEPIGGSHNTVGSWILGSSITVIGSLLVTQYYNSLDTGLMDNL